MIEVVEELGRNGGKNRGGQERWREIEGRRREERPRWRF
jgi:hypothetical protein